MTVSCHSLKYGKKSGGQVSLERMRGAPSIPGIGQDGGVVLLRRAAKYKQSAGPQIITSASALARVSSSMIFSNFACEREYWRNWWKP